VDDKISPASGDYLRESLAKGVVRLTVEVKTEFFESSQRTLIAEIPGRKAPEERIVLVAHADNNRPGANNNASGVGTHAELARTFAHLLQQGTIPPPERTLTFLFGSEREGTRQWLTRLGDGVDNVLAMLNADMTGANTEITGGTYRLEKSPEPTMHIQRPAQHTLPEDQHSGWGFRPIDIDPYPGHFLNDFIWNIVETYARENHWTVNRQPFEGGSDHDVSLPLRIPTVLSWHWVDYFIGTNMDTPDKVSRDEMTRVAVVHGIAAQILALGESTDAAVLLRVVNNSAEQRLRHEATTAEAVLRDWTSTAGGQSFGESYRMQIKFIERWAFWYEEALLSIRDFPVGAPEERLMEGIESARRQLINLKEALIKAIPSERPVALN